MPYPRGKELELPVAVMVIPLLNAVGGSLAIFELSIKIFWSLFHGDNLWAYYPIFKYVTAFKAKLLNVCELPLNKILNVTVPVFESNEA